MADVPEHNPMKDVYFFITVVVIIIILWYASGGPSRADLRGVFLGAPTEAGGSGQAYGPQFPDQTQTVAPPPSVDAPATTSYTY